MPILDLCMVAMSLPPLYTCRLQLSYTFAVFLRIHRSHGVFVASAWLTSCQALCTPRDLPLEASSNLHNGKCIEGQDGQLHLLSTHTANQLEWHGAVLWVGFIGAGRGARVHLTNT